MTIQHHFIDTNPKWDIWFTDISFHNSLHNICTHNVMLTISIYKRLCMKARMRICFFFYNGTSFLTSVKNSRKYEWEERLEVIFVLQRVLILDYIVYQTITFLDFVQASARVRRSFHMSHKLVISSSYCSYIRLYLQQYRVLLCL